MAALNTGKINTAVPQTTWPLPQNAVYTYDVDIFTITPVGGAAHLLNFYTTTAVLVA